MKQPTEKAFESYVEQMLLAKGWQQGSAREWDKERAFFPLAITDFIAETQTALWKAMREQHADNLEPMLLATLVKELAIKGSLNVLRRGFKFYGKTFHLAYFKPAHGLNEEVLALYQANRLTVTRQVPCHPGAPSTVALVFAVTGLPVATCDLTTPWSGPGCRHSAQQ